jgi:multidrug efflux pump subunit AcrA (membrane-fusion protein)
MTGIVRSGTKRVGKAFKEVGEEIGLIPEAPSVDTAAVDRATREATAARREALKQQSLLAAEQAEARRRLEAEQRDLAAQGSSRRRAARRGGLRALLSEERLNPEIGLTDPSRLGA